MSVARLSLAVALWVLLALPTAASAQRGLVLVPGTGAQPRVALVIGNSAYREAPLTNPVNDATDMAAVLRGLGFSVALRANATRADMKTALREFAQSLREGGVGLFYYAGHGIQSRGRNYLIPVDASIQSEAELEYESVDANLVLSYMDEARSRVNIVVLDACRNNPFARSFRSASRGLVQMEAGRGTFIAFATAPGSVAADGDGRNGLYTRYLLQSLKHRDSDIDKVFRRVTAEVARATNGAQVPWVSTSLTGDFAFRPDATAASQVLAQDASAPAPPSQAVELAFWDSIKDSRNPADFREYLVQFPAGRFAGLARNRLGGEQPQAPRVALVAPSAASAPPPSAGTVSEPGLRIGDRWVMRVVDGFNGQESRTFEERVESGTGRRLNLIQTTLTAASDSEGIGRPQAVALDVATWSVRGARLLEGDNMLMSFPLHVGKTWQYEFKARGGGGVVQNVARTAEVTAWEEVRVPAGMFRALKIVHSGSWTNEGGRGYPGTETHTIWYAPDAKRWIKREVQQHDSRGRIKAYYIVELVKADLRQ